MEVFGILHLLKISAEFVCSVDLFRINFRLVSCCVDDAGFLIIFRVSQSICRYVHFILAQFSMPYKYIKLHCN